MAKPIFVVFVPIHIPEESRNDILKALKEKLDDYHVLTVLKNQDDVSFECFNDCNGLKDDDIARYIDDMAELIKTLKNGGDK